MSDEAKDPVADAQAEQPAPITPQEVVNALSAVKDSIISIAQARPESAGISTVARQTIDALDTAYLFYQSLIGLVNRMDQAVEDKVAAGDVVDFPGAKDATPQS